jgi:periplasmic copper chaperone A
MKHRAFAAAAAACVFGLATAIPAHEFTAGTIVIDHPMIFETAASALTGGGFMTLTNTGEESDSLIAVRADFPRVELHTSLEEGGVTKMVHVEAIEIPAGESVALEPGSHHVMFMGLDGDPFEAGEEIPATLVFETAGEVEVAFKVEARAATSGANHSGHDMSH